ncbi:hypothetical protein [Nocardioides sp. YIM 152588]|uniref:hypothetical protein n=1 Tax=Nocardioides sp. YIM 152588 TaxID=3158259 RepID=UPI0032E4BF1A
MPPPRMTSAGRRRAAVLGAFALAAGAAAAGAIARRAAPAVGRPASGEPTPDRAVPASTGPDGRPERFTILPDDYGVPYAGTAGDGRRFFLGGDLFVPGASSYVGLFLWHADGTFDEALVEEVRGPAAVRQAVEERLASLGAYVIEPIVVAPFTEEIDGVTFGWKVDRYDDGAWFITIEPGDFIAYNAPWDGLEYDS